MVDPIGSQTRPDPDLKVGGELTKVGGVQPPSLGGLGLETRSDRQTRVRTQLCRKLEFCEKVTFSSFAKKCKKLEKVDQKNDQKKVKKK
jgi:hypothetical protein